MKLSQGVPAAAIVLVISVTSCFEQPSSGPSASEIDALRMADEAQLAMEETRNAYDWQAAEVEKRSLELDQQLQGLEAELQQRKDADLQAKLEALRAETERLRAEGERARAESERITREVEQIRRATPVVSQAPAYRPEWDGLFRERLEPYGNWVNVSGYGECWDPMTGSRNDWRPYMDGSWGWSDQGWSWVSNEPFGWATYHYGRWVRVARYGWVWVPGMEWAPAWVSWRSGGSHVGWAPLPPEPAGYSWNSVGGDCDSRYRLQPTQYVFVPVNQFVSPSYQRVCVPQVQVTQFFHQTVNVTQIVHLNVNTPGHHQDHGRGGRVFGQAGGPDRRWIDRESRAEIPTTRPRFADGTMVAGEIVRPEGSGPVRAVEAVRDVPAESVSQERIRRPGMVVQSQEAPSIIIPSEVGRQSDPRMRGGDRLSVPTEPVVEVRPGGAATGVPSIRRDLPASEPASIDPALAESRSMRGARENQGADKGTVLIERPNESSAMGRGSVRSQVNTNAGEAVKSTPTEPQPEAGEAIPSGETSVTVDGASMETEAQKFGGVRGRGRSGSRGEGLDEREEMSRGGLPLVADKLLTDGPTGIVNGPVPPSVIKGSSGGDVKAAPDQPAAMPESDATAQQAAIESQRATAEAAAQQQAMEAQKTAEMEAARMAADEQAKQQAVMEAQRATAEAAAQQQAMEAARMAADEQAKQQAAMEAQRATAEAAAQQQTMEAQRAAEMEAARMAANAQAKQQAAMEAQRQAEEAARRAAEEQMRQQQAMEAQRQAEEAARRAAEEQMRQQQAMEAQRQAEEAARRAAEEQMRQQQAMEAQRQAEEAARRAAEEQMRRQAEEAQRQTQEAAQRAAEEQMRRQAEEAQRQAQEAAQRAAEEAARQQGAGN